MKPVRHASNTRTLQAPAGWDQSGLPVEPLGITDTELEGVPCVMSFWQPDQVELANIAAGGLIGLSIVGRTMPPACVMTLYPADSAARSLEHSKLLLTSAAQTLRENVEELALNVAAGAEPDWSQDPAAKIVYDHGMSLANALEQLARTFVLPPGASTVEQAAADLVAMAQAAGEVVTIELQPLQPLAMRNYRMVPTVRKARS